MSLLKSSGLDSNRILLEGCAEGWAVESCPLDDEGTERNADIRMKITGFRRIIYKQKLRTKSLSRYLFSTPRKHIHTVGPIKPQFPITSPEGLTSRPLPRSLRNFHSSNDSDKLAIHAHHRSNHPGSAEPRLQAFRGSCRIPRSGR